jgi:hypothetical protein
LSRVVPLFFTIFLFILHASAGVPLLSAEMNRTNNPKAIHGLRPLWAFICGLRLVVGLGYIAVATWSVLRGGLAGPKVSRSFARRRCRPTADATRPPSPPRYPSGRRRRTSARGHLAAAAANHAARRSRRSSPPVVTATPAPWID